MESPSAALTDGLIRGFGRCCGFWSRTEGASHAHGWWNRARALSSDPMGKGAPSSFPLEASRFRLSPTASSAEQISGALEEQHANRDID